jgi:hypothetical protein
MRNHEQHFSDEELLLAEDAELGKRANRLRAHLEGCPQCRTRAARMEKVLHELAWAERSSLEAELGSIEGPRAALRTRLAELSTGGASFFQRHGMFGGFVAGAVGVAALAAVMVFAAVLSFRQVTAMNGSSFSLLAPNRGVLPNPALTPGAARQASLEQVCSLSHEEVIKPVSAAERERVFAEYGISNAHSDQYEVDYLITPGLGGYDDIRNLWPEPYQHARWNAHMKDALEERLHEMVCSHQLDLTVAQEAIATNWIAAYQKYVETAPSHARGIGAPLLPQTATLILQVKP